jgi:hypothetical protein
MEASQSRVLWMEQQMVRGPGRSAETNRFIGLCTCRACPSYRDCQEGGSGPELGFCLEEIGKSRCIDNEKGCICPQCPVTPMLGLTKTFFCTRGSEKEQKA